MVGQNKSENNKCSGFTKRITNSQHSAVTSKKPPGLGKTGKKDLVVSIPVFLCSFSSTGFLLILSYKRRFTFLFLKYISHMTLISLSHTVRSDLKSAICGKINELGKYCFMKTKFEPNSAYFS